MARVLVDFPFTYYTAFNIGRPIFNGLVYIGEADQDPKTTPKDLIAIQEDGSEVPLPNPFSLSRGGVPLLNNNPVNVIVEDNYSMIVEDQTGKTEYSIPNRFESDPVSTLDTVLVFQSLQNLIASSVTVGQTALTLGYYEVDDGGGRTL